MSFALLACTLLALAGLCVWSRASSPSDDTVVNVGDVAVGDGRVVLQRDTTDGAMRAGDEVLAIDGRNVTDWLAHRVGGEALRDGQVLTYDLRRGDRALTVRHQLAPYPVADSLVRNWPTILVILMLLGAAVFIFAVRPRDPAARAALVASSLAALTTTAAGYFDLEAVDLVAGGQFWRWCGGQVVYAVLWGAMLHFALAFPEVTSRRRYRRWLLIGYAGPLLIYLGSSAVAWLAVQDPVRRFSVLSSPAWLTIYVYPVLILAVLVQKYRYCHNQAIRSRLRWLALSLGGATLSYLAVWVLPLAVTGRALLPIELHSLVFVPIPIAVAAAILRHRALGIEIVISRSLIYAALSAVAIAGYVLVVGLLSMAFPPLHGLWQQATAAAVVATALQPLRIRMQALINQRVFGDRDDPYRVVSALAEQLEGTRTPSTVLPAVVETVGGALRLPYVAIEIRRADHSEPAASYGTPAGDLVRLPLTYQGERVGQLVVSPRTPKEALRRKDLRALAEVARQAGAVVYAARLTGDLERSRVRLVRAREEERRRLLHDLHDGVGPTLAAIVLGLHAGVQTIERDPQSARDLLVRLQEELQQAIGEIRRVAENLRPPALDHLGLITAVRQHANTLSSRMAPTGRSAQHTDIVIDAPPRLPPLPAAVEVAAYRIICEALTNMARHADARSCAVRLWLDQDLHLEILDDGTGVSLTASGGVGLESMRGRALELGGDCVVEPVDPRGTRVTARLPLPKEGADHA
ncbi:hypothetical protein F0L68_23565 [Solihabitans fulvus]|uniref:Histidine kinase/HSP90-like ATPase domain-containing protein n=1 Tax=Solihabitans fulvus TaxID=1892852 RepID=A0A5B2X6E4_9PSEU|nr:histidine kinase [Solihabitans fulvus]KAA2258803.1 hypothetical protein F0L68_23565 [Solihabitans fulvus]